MTRSDRLAPGNDDAFDRWLARIVNDDDFVGRLRLGVYGRKAPRKRMRSIVREDKCHGPASLTL